MSELTHRIYSPWSQRIFWNGNSAGNSNSATRVVVQVGPDMYYRSLEFVWPNDIGKIDKLEAMLEAAYELGRSAAKKEIREVLGVKEPRS